MMIHIYIGAFTHKYTTICMNIHMRIQLYVMYVYDSWWETARTDSCDEGAHRPDLQARGPSGEQERPRDTCVPERVSPSKDIQDGWVGMYRPLQGIID